ncbi:tyrosine-type recombinase/integrase [Endozoicomonas sp. 2B-B]
MPLSDTKLRNIAGKPYSGKPELADRDGLSVRISGSGTISWQYRFRFQGKAARLTVGRYPDLSLKEARETLPDIRNLLANNIDPRKAWKQSTSDVITAEDCVKKFLKIRVPKLKEKSQVLYKSVFNRHFKTLFPGRAIDSVPLDEWLDWFDEMAEDNPKIASSLLKSAKTLFNWCSRRRMINPPAMMILKPGDVGLPSDTGERVLTLNECGEIWKALDRSRAAASTQICIKLCMLYGCRQSEIRESHRDHFDMQEMVWTVPKELSKTNKPIRRPITSETEKLIRMAWSFYGEAGYLLPAEQKQDRPCHYSVINKTVRAIRQRLRNDKKVIESWRCHDFRRTISTRLSEEGIMPHVTEKMLGHVLTGVMAVYNKHDWLEDQRNAYELWNSKILAAIG